MKSEEFEVENYYKWEPSTEYRASYSRKRFFKLLTSAFKTFLM